MADVYLAVQSAKPGSSLLTLIDAEPSTTGYKIDRAGGVDLGSAVYDKTYSGPRGTQGAVLVGATAQNRLSTWTLQVIGTSEDDLQAKLSALWALDEDLRRYGGTAYWRAWNSSYLMTLNVLDSGVGSPVLDPDLWPKNHIVKVPFGLVTPPYMSGPSMDILDDFSYVGPVLVRNLLTNPSAEVDTANWSVNNGTLTRDATTAASGAASLKGTAGASGGNYYYSDGAVSGASAGRLFTGSVYVKGTGATIGKTLTIFLSEAGGATGESTGGVHTDGSVTLTGAFQRLSCSRVMTQNDRTIVRLYVAEQVGAANGDIIFFDAAQIEEAGLVGAYVDGSVSGGTWEGTANASPSNLRATTMGDYQNSKSMVGGVLKQDSAGLPAGLMPHTGRGYDYADVQVTVKGTITALGGGNSNYALSPGLKWQVGDGKYIWATNEASNLVIYYFNGAANSVLAAVAITAPVVGDTRWLRIRSEGNIITAEWFTSAPSPMSAPASSISFTLTAATTPTEAQMGSERAGKCSPISWNMGSGGGADVDDFDVDPYTYTNHALPE